MKKFKEKLKQVLLLKNISAEELCQQIGMSRQNLNYIYGRGSIETKWLEKISEVLQVPMTYWFEENENKSINSIEPKQPQRVLYTENCPNCEVLQKIIHSQEKTISALEKAVEALSKQLGEVHSIKDTGS